MDLKIKGKKAIMAGGSAGMGRATAEYLAEAGAELVITARGMERLEKAADEISSQYGVNVTPVAADSSTEEGRAALFEACPDPDILCITISPPTINGDFLKIDAQQWRDSIESTVIGPIELMRHYIPGMKEKGWGRICNIATFSAKNPMIWRLMSGPPRTTLLNYIAAVSREVAGHGVIMNNVLPGMFETDGSEKQIPFYAEAFGLPMDRDTIVAHFDQHNQIPTGGIGQADDIASIAAYFCSDLCRFIVGQNVTVDGGQHRSIF